MRKILFLVLMLLAGCTAQNDSESVEAYFCESFDCYSKIVELISSSSSLDCALYSFDMPMQILLSGKNARVVTDKKNIHGFLTDESSSLMHNKFCIINESVVFTGSFNLINSSDYNNLLLVSSPRFAGRYREEFDEMQKGVFHRGNKGSSVPVKIGTSELTVAFCPEDDCLELARDAINSAQKTIYFALFDFTLDELAVDLIIKKHEGIEVLGVLEKSRVGRNSVYRFLKLQGIDVKAETSPKLLHHKFFVVDNEIVITGSMNPTRNGISRNDENLIVIRDSKLAEQYVEEFFLISKSAKYI